MTTRHLDGKTALVTGGSRGIGAGIVTRLAAEGAHVAFTYVNSKEQADALVATVSAAGGTALAIRADSLQEQDVESAVQQTADRFGSVDILVNNAASVKFAPIDEYTMEEIDAMWTVLVRSSIVAIRKSLLHMGTGGRIINIGSINADRTQFPGQSIYAMSKGAVASLTRSLSRDLAGRGITVNNVQPGPVDTEANPENGPMAPILLGAMAIDRFGTTAEVASLVAYLAGPDAGYITGASLNIDGGFTA